MTLTDSIKKIIIDLESQGDVKAVFGEPRKKGIENIVPVSLLEIKKNSATDSTDNSLTGKIKKFFPRFKNKKNFKPAGYIKIKDGLAHFVPLNLDGEAGENTIPPFGLGALLLMKLIMDEDDRRKIGGNA